MLKENIDDFSERLKGKMVIADKGYVSKEFAEEMESRGVKFIAVKRKNMIKTEDEIKYYHSPSKLRKKIETLFSIADDFGLKFIYKSRIQKRSRCQNNSWFVDL